MKDSIREYIAKMNVGPVDFKLAIPKGAVVPPLEKLPRGVVTGSSMIEFPKDINPEIRTSVVLSLLAAQRVATHDKTVTTPDLWIERHNEVLSNLNWVTEDHGFEKKEFSDLDTAVHKAIIPFLTAAFGGVGGALIITALKQLQEMDENNPWITLFNHESKRYSITDYQFAVVKTEGNTVHLRIATMRFDAKFEKYCVLFFVLKKKNMEFISAWNQLAGDTDLLVEMNAELKKKLAVLAQAYIQEIPEKYLKLGTPERETAMIA